MEEPLVDFYYEKLKHGNQIATLVGFYESLFNVKADKSVYPMLGRFIKIYGVDIVFMSLIDASDVEIDKTKSMAGLLAYFAKKRVESKFSLNASKDLTRLSQSNMERLSNE